MRKNFKLVPFQLVTIKRNYHQEMQILKHQNLNKSINNKKSLILVEQPLLEICNQENHL
jgi:hypothetical protein